MTVPEHRCPPGVICDWCSMEYGYRGADAADAPDRPVPEDAVPEDAVPEPPKYRSYRDFLDERGVPRLPPVACSKEA